jgi:hypothetical protein
LEERIQHARRLSDRLETEIERLGHNSGMVGNDLAALNTELDRAGQELEFLGAEVGFGFEVRAVRRSERPSWDESEDSPRRSVGAYVRENGVQTATVASSNTPYLEFTSPRYNRAVGQLRNRRRRLIGWTVGLAVAISVALEVLNMFAREPLPPWWLAVLPAIWLIPLPFFFLSFRGTHRILKTTPLEIRADS